MCTDLGVVMVAEGIETEVERDAYLAIGVVFGQGWLFAPALRLPDLVQRLLAEQRLSR
jgi:sensor c-di-GMP phosphodiesterase-like protein